MKKERIFDKNWKNAIDGAEATPSPSVWNNILRELVIQEGNSIRQRLTFYQRLAVASVLVAIILSGWIGYRWLQSDEVTPHTKFATQHNPPKPKTTTDSIPNATQKNLLLPAKKDRNQPPSSTEVKPLSDVNNLAKAQSFLKNDNSYDLTVAAFTDKKRHEQNEDDLSTSEIDYTKNLNHSKTLEGFDSGEYRLPVVAITSQPKYVEIVRVLPAIPASFMAPRKSEAESEKIWAAVTATSGNTIASSNPYSYTSTSSQGNSYSVGALGGILIATHWVVQSGLLYVNQVANPFSIIAGNNSLSSVASYALVKQPSTTATNYSSAYAIVSTNEFVSLPVMVGYVLTKKKFAWQINSGISTDLFLRNTLTDPNGQMQSYSQSAGADSPYRTTIVAGLFNNEVSYRLGKNYRLAIVPGVKYSLSPLLKSQSSSNLLLLDIGFRFR